MPALQSSQKPLAELNPYPKQRRDRATDLGSFWKVWDNWNKLKILKPFYFEGTQFWPIYFFLWSQRSWAAHFLSPEDAPQRQLWPGIQRLCLTKDGAERKWGSRMGHTCSSLSCVNHPIGKPKELTQTYGVWNVEAAWIRIRKDLGLGFYQWLEQRIEQTQNEQKMPSRYPQSKRNKTSGWSISLVTSGHRPPPTRFPCLQI